MKAGFMIKVMLSTDEEASIQNMEWDGMTINVTLPCIEVTLGFMRIWEIVKNFYHGTTTIWVSPTIKMVGQIKEGGQTALATITVLEDILRFAMKVSTMMSSQIILAVTREKEQNCTILESLKIISPQVMVGQ